jgi:hypothetical protein
MADSMLCLNTITTATSPSFWDLVCKEKIFPFDHAIVDFGIVGPPGHQRVVIIECNPFVCCTHQRTIAEFHWLTELIVLAVGLSVQDAYTGPALFDWERDWDVLTNGPFQTRIIQSPEQIKQSQRVANEGWHLEIEEATRRVNEKRRQHKQKMMCYLAGGALLAGGAAYLYAQSKQQ